MRSIKFRAWGVEENRWLDLAREMAFIDNGDGLGLIILDCPYRIVFEQFTGQKDETGKDIYEGDQFIISIAPGMQAIDTVIWYDFGWHGIPASNTGAYPLTEKLTKNIKVVGNIHEGTK